MMINFLKEGPWRAFREWLLTCPGIREKPDGRYFEEDSKAKALRIPSIVGMKIIYFGFVLHLLKNGVFVKAKKLKFQKAEGDVKRMNAYLTKQIRRLKKLVANGEYRRFWRLWFIIMSKSVTFGFLALQKVLPHWYKELPLEEVKNIMKKFEEIRRGWKTEYQVKEVEIPKPNGKTRTLSVPTKPWRLYLYLVNLGLHLFLNPKINLVTEREWE